MRRWRNKIKVSTKKTLLKNLIDLRYFPDHRGYTRSKNPSLSAHMLPGDFTDLGAGLQAYYIHYIMTIDRSSPP